MVFKVNLYRDYSLILRYFTCFSLGCTAYFLTVTFNSQPQTIESGEWQIGDVHSRFRLFVGDNVVVGRNNFEISLFRGNSNACNSVNIAMIATTPDSAREAVTCIKSILNSRERPLMLHLIVSEQTDKIFTALFDTWQLPLVQFSVYYKEKKAASSKDDNGTFQQQIDTFLALPNILPKSITKIIAIDIKMRFFEGIEQLWDEFRSFKSYQSIGMTKVSQRGKDGFQPNFLLMDLKNMRLRTLPLRKTALVTMTNHEFHEIDCSWDIKMDAYSSQNSCPAGIKQPKALVYNPAAESHSGFLEPTLDKLEIITKSNGDLFRTTAIPCSGENPLVPGFSDDVFHDKCAEFIFSARLKRRTHLFYMGTPASNKDPHEITLMTMFTLDRFDAFELMLKYWTGPVTAVAYVTDEEILTLTKKLQRSENIQNRSNIVYHIVYKRHRLYPINYVRNIALRNTHTAYSIFVDVDLVPNKNLYKYLKQYIMNNPHDNVCLIVPAFEALTTLTQNPETRPDLKKLLAAGSVVGYGEKGFADGHRPTNYAKWRNTSKPYYVMFEPKFEPYILMRTREMPLYDEDVLDRMGDKALFTSDLNTIGYKFRVLPETFLVHHPHPISDNKLIQNDKIFLRCKHQLMDNHRIRFNTAVPSKSFTAKPTSEDTRTKTRSKD